MIAWLGTFSTIEPCDASREYEVSRILHNIGMVECYPTGLPCNHKGIYQIGEEYWIDSETRGKWESVENPGYARLVILNYWRKFKFDDFEKLSIEPLVRSHYNLDLYWTRYQFVDRGYHWNGTRIKNNLFDK